MSQDSVPRAGIRLLKEETPSTQLIQLSSRPIKFHLIEYLKLLTSKLPLDEKMSIQSSWDRLRDSLEEGE